MNRKLEISIVPFTAFGKLSQRDKHSVTELVEGAEVQEVLFRNKGF